MLTLDNDFIFSHLLNSIQCFCLLLPFTKLLKQKHNKCNKKTHTKNKVGNYQMLQLNLFKTLLSFSYFPY